MPKHLSSRTALIIILVGSALVWIPILLHMTGPKEVATAEQVRIAILEAGYQPVDATELYTEDMPGLIQCIAFEKDDEYFNFYVFQDHRGSGNLYGHIASYININYSGAACAEHTSAQSNYCIRTVTVHGRYVVDIYVDNTVVYAHCNEGNEQGICDVLHTIGYFD